MNEVIREFLLETQENLAQLDLDLVTLEREPTERETLARAFRTLHTIKGTAGFLGMLKLQAVAHSAENLLSRLTSGELTFNRAIASAMMSTVDTIRHMLVQVEKAEQEGDGDYSELIQTLEQLRTMEAGKAPRRQSITQVPVFQAPPPRPKREGPAESTASAKVAPVVATSAPALPLRNDKVAPSSFRPSMAPPAEPAYLERNGLDNGENGPPTSARVPVEATSNLDLAKPHPTAISEGSIRVDVGLLDDLMNLVGELVLTRNQLAQFSGAHEDSAFLGAIQRLNALTTELQSGVMKTRMQPIGTTWSKFPRLVRDMAMACGKQVSFEMDGQETDLDKTVIEAIRDPLIHMIRNAIDHGIEAPAERKQRGKPDEGYLRLHAFHEGGKVIIEIDDDGAGIDLQRVRNRAVKSKLLSPEQVDKMSKRELMNLVFLPGFSTAEKVTHFSGRGVGMNVVRTNIEKIGGAVEIESCVGLGTTITVKIPLTLAIIPALTVTCAGDRYCIPQISLLELIHLDGDEVRHGVEYVHGAPVYRLRGNLLPLVNLDAQLQVDAPHDPDVLPGELNIVVLKADDHSFGLIVDEIRDTREIVVKPLQKQLQDLHAFSGATILGDGKVALILDILGLAQRANIITGMRERAVPEKPSAVSEPPEEPQTLILFDAPGGRRMALPLAEVSRLEEFPRSALEKIGNQYAVLYRDDILSLIDVAEVLQLSPRGGGGPRVMDGIFWQADAADTVQFVVHSRRGRHIGLVVGRILDIVKETTPTEPRPGQNGISTSMEIQDRITEILDIEGIVRLSNPEFFHEPEAVAEEV